MANGAQHFERWTRTRDVSFPLIPFSIFEL